MTLSRVSLRKPSKSLLCQSGDVAVAASAQAAEGERHCHIWLDMVIPFVDCHTPVDRLSYLP
jgi:hypothetical protein